MDYYWLTTAVAILIFVIGIILSTISGPREIQKRAREGWHRPRLTRSTFDLHTILVSIVIGLFVKIIADLLYEVINNNFPEHSNITKIVLAFGLLVIIVILYLLNRSAKSRYRKITRARKRTRGLEPREELTEVSPAC